MKEWWFSGCEAVTTCSHARLETVDTGGPITHAECQNMQNAIIGMLFPKKVGQKGDKPVTSKRGQLQLSSEQVGEAVSWATHA